MLHLAGSRSRTLIWFVTFTCNMAGVWLQPAAAEDDRLRTVMLQAIACKPHPRQVAWQENEFTGFIHFGVNTFTGREWGTGQEDPNIFQPGERCQYRNIYLLPVDGLRRKSRCRLY